ncbi:DUF3558 domain-containing protein [Saccharomonospora glauca]|uniref:DUF3558 domain-containing protein n=1 Tax=Saccharomonospora glauca K62 TaxID=928724 RepID=I1CYU7_9PSEU|nr:DUF3558 domain-containing protein [Saccharomonospora glauca]EIE97871.1 Protein of unknown function (DUF3558) [Saccharomonospora glauca K62]
MTRFALLPALALLVLTTACGDGTEGIAQSDPSTEPTPQSQSPSTAPTKSGLSATLEPCELLIPDADMARYGSFHEGRYREAAGARLCSWQRQDDATAKSGLVISVGVRDSQSVDTLTDVGGGINSGEVNGRSAAEAPDPRYGSCTLAVAVDDHSRVDIGITAMDDVNAACDVAREVAYLVEPRLPTA